MVGYDRADTDMPIPYKYQSSNADLWGLRKKEIYRSVAAANISLLQQHNLSDSVVSLLTRPPMNGAFLHSLYIDLTVYNKQRVDAPTSHLSADIVCIDGPTALSSKRRHLFCTFT